MKTHISELIIPPLATADPKAVEILRVWASGGKQHVAIATGLWNDPAKWGIMLVDLARHIANIFEQSEGKDFQVALDRLKAGFDAEWSHQTDMPSGTIESPAN